MPMTTTALALGPDLTIGQAAACREAVLAHLLTHPGDLHLDLGQVDEMDSSAVQWLLAARRSAEHRGDMLCIDAASAVVQEALRTLGASDLLATTP